MFDWELVPGRDSDVLVLERIESGETLLGPDGETVERHHASVAPVEHTRFRSCRRRERTRLTEECKNWGSERLCLATNKLP